MKEIDLNLLYATCQDFCSFFIIINLCDCSSSLSPPPSACSHANCMYNYWLALFDVIVIFVIFFIIRYCFCCCCSCLIVFIVYKLFAILLFYTCGMQSRYKPRLERIQLKGQIESESEGGREEEREEEERERGGRARGENVRRRKNQFFTCCAASMLRHTNFYFFFCFRRLKN